MSEERKPTTYVALVLDRSGSMLSMRDTAIKCFNDQLQVLKDEVAHHNSVVTVVTFADAGELKVIRKAVPAEDVACITNADYMPNGSTAMYDALADTMELMLSQHTLGAEDAVLILTITDGAENDSTKHRGNAGCEYVKGMLHALQLTGHWTFAFMGTEDALRTVQEMGAYSSNTVLFNTATLDSVSASTSSATRGYYCARENGEMQTMSFYDNRVEDPPTPDSVSATFM
jgi:hypothetical protein